jgi:RNA-directed DNA polymerase
LSLQTVSTKLARIAEQSKRNPTMVFTTLAHLMDEDFLKEAFHQLRKDAAAGVDQIRAKEYAEDLEGNIRELHKRLRERRYKAQPARRAWAKKDDGSQRPLAILALEDKIVQRAVAMLLEAVYEPMFHEFSFGFRRGRSAHQALTYLRQQCLELNINWILDVDIQKFFDSIDRGHLREILKRRVNDGTILQLIGKWLNAGVLEEEKIVKTENGTLQGAVISPILANIFLHTVLDEWFKQEVEPRIRGRCFLVRFADDFVCGFQYRGGAEWVFEELPKRFEKYGLTIHPKKSRLVQFSRPYWSKGKGPGTFDFLGFTHYWGKTRAGGWTIKRITQKKRLRRFMKALWEWCKRNRHIRVTEQHQMLCAKLRGHYQYYGVRGNYKMLEVVFEHAERTWKRWLGRRTRDGKIAWEEFEDSYRKVFPLPTPRIIHAF